MFLVLLWRTGFELLGLVGARLAVSLEPGEELTLADRLQIQFSIVVLASGNVFGVFAVTSAVGVSDLENGSDGATVLAGNALETDVIFTAIFGMSVTAERASVGDLTGGWAAESVCYFFVFALRNLISPHADAGLSVVGKSGAALIAGGFSVPAVPENVALVFIREDAVQSRTVRSGDWGLKLCPLSALNVVKVVAVLGQVFGICGVESETVTAGFQFGNTIVALPVFVTGDVVRVETEVVGAFEGLLGHSYAEGGR